jgi:SnoaL-like domain
VPATPQEIFERYMFLGALTRNADELAEMFTADGVLEAPLVPPGGAFPRRLVGRDEIREGLAAYYERSANSGRSRHELQTSKSRYVLHTTTDPDVFVAEVDTLLEGLTETTTMSLVQIFRLHDGQLALVRDYFALEQMQGPSPGGEGPG